MVASRVLWALVGAVRCISFVGLCVCGFGLLALAWLCPACFVCFGWVCACFVGWWVIYFIARLMIGVCFVVRSWLAGAVWGCVVKLGYCWLFDGGFASALVVRVYCRCTPFVAWVCFWF